MRILSIALRNFKNHQDNYFAFEDGINAICGENGSGKTSILEGIAWVLFDYTPYVEKEMIRLGANSAEVAVNIISNRDYRTYEVRRSTTKGYTLYDPQLNQRLEYERKADVLHWIREQLGVPSGTDLARLFTTTIGVPQGLFTADFLKTPQERKKTFDCILKVEEYQTIYKDLLPLENYSKEQISEISHQLNRREERLLEWETLHSQQQNLTELLTEKQAELSQTQSSLSQYQREVVRLGGISQTLSDWDQQLQQLYHQGSLYQVQLQQAEKLWQEAEQAQSEVRQHTDGYQAYLAAEQHLANLEDRYQQRQSILAERQRLWELHQAENDQHIRLQERLVQFEKIRTQIEQLQPLAAQQNQWLEQQQYLIEQIQKRQAIIDQVTILRTHWESQNEWIGQKRQALEAAHQAYQQCQQHQPGYEAYIHAEIELSKLDQSLQKQRHLLKQREQAQASYHKLQVEQTKLDQHRQRAIELEHNIHAHQPQLAQQKSLETKQVELKVKIQEFQSLRLQLGQREAEQAERQKYRQTFVEQLAQRQTLQQQVARIPELEQQQERLTSQLSRLAAAQQFHQELLNLTKTGHARFTAHQQRIEQVLQRFANLDQEFPEVAHRLAAIPNLFQEGCQISQYLLDGIQVILQDISNQVSPKDLEAQQQNLKAELQQIYPLQGLVNEIPELQVQIQAYEKSIAELQENIDDLLWQTEAEALFLRQLAELETQMEIIGDPAAQIKLWQMERDAIPSWQEEWLTIVAELEKQSQTLQQLETTLSRVQDLDAQVAVQQHIKMNHKNDYELYLQAHNLASTFSHHQADLELSLAKLQEIEQTGKKYQDQINQHQNQTGSLAAMTEQLTLIQEQLQQLRDPHSQILRYQEILLEEPKILEQFQRSQQQLTATQSHLEHLNRQLTETIAIDAEMTQWREAKQQYRLSYETYKAHEALVHLLPEREKNYRNLQADIQANQAQQTQLRLKRDPLAASYSADYHQTAQANLRQAEIKQASLASEIQSLEPQLAAIEAKLTELETIRLEKQEYEVNLAERERLHRFIKFSRSVFKDAGPRITKLYLQNINIVADQLFREILNRSNVSLTWETDYDITIQEGGSPKRRFACLSGGEQMSAALAVRLALLKVLGDLDVAFFDEPTTNMDRQRRQQLAEAINQIRSFRQIFVISHDDTFEHITENIIRVERKEFNYGY
ncbi:MAG: AAA family ATPase [Cyanobacteriota bacterium]|nr:AAA family ATPase [Cyanobacteriota bacterium]